MDAPETPGMDPETVLTVALYALAGAAVAWSLLRWALVRRLPNHVAGPGGWLIDTRHGRGVLDLRAPERRGGAGPLRHDLTGGDGGGDGGGCGGD